MVANASSTLGPRPDKDLSSADVHDHLCFFYESREELLKTLIPFFKHGLERGERCVYIGDELPSVELIDALKTSGVDAPEHIKDGSLLVLNVKHAYLQGARFDLDRVFRLFRESVEQSQKDGRPALRVAGEAAWMRGDVPGGERFFEYEARINDLFKDLDVLALCLYERGHFGPEFLQKALCAHPGVVKRNKIIHNSHYTPWPGTARILLVDDESSVRHFCERVLTQHGYGVLAASSGEKALLLLQKDSRQEIQMMITDMVMPGMSGKTLAEEATRLRPDLKILFVSGYSEDFRETTDLGGPGRRLLEKPFPPARLLVEISALLG